MEAQSEQNEAAAKVLDVFFPPMAPLVIPIVTPFEPAIENVTPPMFSSISESSSSVAPEKDTKKKGKERTKERKGHPGKSPLKRSFSVATLTRTTPSINPRDYDSSDKSTKRKKSKIPRLKKEDLGSLITDRLPSIDESNYPTPRQESSSSSMTPSSSNLSGAHPQRARLLRSVSVLDLKSHARESKPYSSLLKQISSTDVRNIKDIKLTEHSIKNTLESLEQEGLISFRHVDNKIIATKLKMEVGEDNPFSITIHTHSTGHNDWHQKEYNKRDFFNLVRRVKPELLKDLLNIGE